MTTMTTCNSARLLRVASLLVALTGLLGAFDAVAQKVTLRSNDGAVTVTGTLKSFDGRTYAIQTDAAGEMRLSASTFSCQSAECPKRPLVFGIHGSNTIGAQLMPAIVEGYAQFLGDRTRIQAGRVPEEIEISILGRDGDERAVISLHSHGSGTSPASLQSRAALIGMMSRPMRDDEAKLLADVGLGDMRAPGREHVLGLDALLVLVAQSNPVDGLSVKQIGDIFSGAITDWSQVGGRPGRIQLYSRDAKSGTFDTFDSLVLRPNNGKLSKEARLFESSPDLSDAVASDPNGIGFAGYAYLRNAKALKVSNECQMIFDPDLFNVKTEEYPLSRRLFLYTGPLEAGSLPSDLIRFSLSNAAQGILIETGFVDQGIKALSTAEQAARSAMIASVNEPAALRARSELTSELKSSLRLSTTIRFRTGSSQLDNKALQDLSGLVDVLRWLEAEKRSNKVLLVGFSDGVGGFESNMRLAAARAQSVRQQLIAASRNQGTARFIETRHFGPLLPVGCDSSEEGKQRNRGGGI